jgi:LysR family transcriptional regulator for bpeEF and oprC
VGNNDLDLNLLKTFSKVLEVGSFTQAAGALKQPKSRVSKAIARLEKELGVQLIQRTTRSVTPTHSGKELYARIALHLQEIEKETVAITQKENKVEGIIRIAASEDIGHSILVDIIEEFNKRYPLVSFEILISNDLINLQKERIDLAFRISKLKDSSIIQKKIGSVELIFTATPGYLKKFGTPSNLRELIDHKVFTFFKTDSQQDFDPIAEILKKDELKFRLSCNSFILLYSQTLKGRGIGLIPDFYCRDDFSKESLVRVLPAFSVGKRNIHVVYPAAKNIPVRTRKFLDFSAEKLKGHFT